MLKQYGHFFIEPFHYTQYAFSIKGKGKEENQDAFALYHDNNCIIAVVADGLGSAVYSGSGSKLICKITVQVLQETNIYSGISEEIRELWLKNNVHKPSASDTTLKFVKITRDKAVFGGIGDGWISALIGRTYISLDAENTFSNHTDTILSGDLGGKFAVKEAVLSAETSCVFSLSTDGFSEDIDKEKGKLFLENIQKDINTEADQFYKNFETALAGWPVKTNLDDKTVVFVQRKLSI
jgi:serine/threonine protein phosphatase PrpC